MKTIYRTSNNSYSKIKPEYINNTNCLNNFIKNFGTPDLIIADNVNDVYFNELLHYNVMIDRTELGSGAQSFKYMLEKYILNNKISNNDNEIIYMVENDYLHLPNTKRVLEDGFNILNPDYLSLYDHPDKYINYSAGGSNPYVEDGGELTRVVTSKFTHWKLTNSTTMTFASRISTLKKDYNIIKKYISGTHPNDFNMFIELRNNGRTLISPIPSYSTHGESLFLSLFVDWDTMTQ